MIKTAKQILRKPFTPTLGDILGRGISVGVITGLIVSLFRWLIDGAMQLISFIYPQMRLHMWLIVPYICLMFIICFALGKIIKPDLDNLVGSGVSQLQAMFLSENKHSKL